VNFFYYDVAGRRYCLPHSTWEIAVSVNDPEFNGPSYLQLTGSGVNLMFEPRKVGELQGFPVYRNRDGNEFVVLTRSGKPFWIPVTREQFVKIWMRVIEKEMAAVGPNSMDQERLDHHKSALASMSAEERQAQARDMQNPDPYGPPMGSTGGRPLVVVNPDWFDPSLPRTAIQLVFAKFVYSSDIAPDHPKPAPYGNIVALRFWEVWHTFDWKAISTVLGN
jgi:hypothetical protein